ncbi:hypothetical protein FXN63_01480 [Pigmentiphaga aceris]|uniref:Calcium-binding protein n=1 Tax=Pigmentiphaga aceris TaxID=1940612 RepID=A0A5C0ARQ6_9BURK|nr:hypothetical protein [Pigmentiphaga aceris]QEI04655.1 hypothetical protein FXN63_01480 [Pigmentiphaga aceris]
MFGEQVAALGAGASRIDTLSNLPIVDMLEYNVSNALLFTPEILAGLFSVAAPASVRLSNGMYAAGAQVNVVAANLDKLSSALGGLRGLNIDRDVSVESIALLTTARAEQGLVHAIYVVPDGMSAAQIEAVSQGMAGTTRPGVSSLWISSTTSADIIAAVLSAPGIGRVNVTVATFGMTDNAQLAAIGLHGASVDSFNTPPPLVLGDAAITDAAAEGLLVLVDRMARGNYTQFSTVQVDATNASPAELALLVTYAQAVQQITGTLVLDATVTDSQLAALLNKAAIAADVQLDVGGMSVAQLTAVKAGLAKVDTIAPINVTGMSTAQLTALADLAPTLGTVSGLSLSFPSGLDVAVLSTLLSKTATGSVSVVGTGASAAELGALAVNLDKIAATGLTGTLLLTKDLSASAITALLGASATAMATINVDATGMSVAQLEAVSDGAARVNSLTNQPDIVLADGTLTDTTLVSLLAMGTEGSLRVNAQGATASQLAIVANAASKLVTDGITGTFTLGASLSAGQLTVLLGDKTSAAATVQADGTGMTSAQLAALYGDRVKLTSLANIPTLMLGDTEMSETLIAWLVSLAPADSLRADTTGASIDKIHVLAGDHGEKIQGDGLTGTLNLTAALKYELFFPFFVSKVAEAANVQVDATGMSMEQLIYISLNRAKIDGVVGVDVSMASFQSDLNFYRYLAPLVAASNDGSVKMDLNGAYWYALQANVLPNMSKFADGGLTGTFTVPGVATIDELRTLLTPKLASDAVVTVQIGTTSDQLLTDLVPLTSKIASITNLQLNLATTTLDNTTLNAVLSKATAAKVWVSGASADKIELVLSKLSHIGAFQDALHLSAEQFNTLDVSLLGTKLVSSPGLSVTGDARNDTIDLAGTTGMIRVDGGAGADTIIGGNGSDRVFIASKADTRADSFSAASTTAQGNIDVITLGNNDSLRFSTEAGVFGPGVIAGRVTSVENRTVGTVNSFDEMYAALNIQGGLQGGANLNEFIRVTVGGGSLAGSYLILNDDTPSVGIDDTIISVTFNGTSAMDLNYFGS